MITVADPGFAKWGPGRARKARGSRRRVAERRRREYRGAEVCGVWGGGIPLPNGRGMEGGIAPSPEIFRF